MGRYGEYALNRISGEIGESRGGSGETEEAQKGFVVERWFIFMISVEKSVYSPVAPTDGRRVLVMTLWPRGVSKVKVDVWLKELGTPRELIKRKKAGKATWAEFKAEYRKSLKGKEAMLKELAEQSKKGTVTLLCTEKDPSECHRSILKEEIERFL
jgi:uncharacterized protein YeaO (DUF488 family)